MWRDEEDREDVVSEDGTVIFNHLQQRPVDTTERPLTPLEVAGGTDPDGITTVGETDPPTDPPNDLINPSFEDDAPAWEANPAPDAFDPASTVWAAHGSRSAYLRKTLTGTANCMIGLPWDPDPLVEIDEAGWYYFALTLNVITPVPAGRIQGMWVDLFDVDGNLVAFTFGASDQTGQTGVFTVEHWEELAPEVARLDAFAVVGPWSSSGVNPFEGTTVFEGYFDQMIATAVGGYGITPAV